MAYYHWQQGNQQGKIQAKNKVSAKALLRRQNIFPEKLRSTHRLFPERKNPRLLKFKTRDFFSKLSLLCEAKLPLIMALEFLQKEHPHPLVTTLIHSLKLGHGFSEALSGHPENFCGMDIALIAMGEKTGRLSVLLKALVSWQHAAAILKQKIKKMLFYPALVLLAAIGLGIFLIIDIVPEFANLYDQFHATLPLPTRMILALSAFFQNAWMILLPTLVGGIIFLYFQKKRLVHIFKICYSSLPIIRPLLQDNLHFQLFFILSIVLDAGLPLASALSLFATHTDNLLFQKKLQRIQEALQQGISLTQAFKASDQFSDWTLQWIEVGEATAELSKVFQDLAKHYETRLAQTQSYWMTLLEPLVMSGLGLLIGGLVIALYLPLLNMGSVIS